jgi:hypothetical protein
MNNNLSQAISMPRPGFRAAGLATGILALFGLLPGAVAQCESANLTRTHAVPVLPGQKSMPALQDGKNSPTAAPQAAPSQATITGLWQINFSSGGEVVDVGFDVWHSDGTEILNDFTNPINGNVCLGTWKQTGSLTYKLTHPAWYFDDSGNLLGTEMLFENVTLSADGKNFNGWYLIDVYDTQGTLVDTFTGSLAASRINP